MAIKQSSLCGKKSHWRNKASQNWILGL